MFCSYNKSQISKNIWLNIKWKTFLFHNKHYVFIQNPFRLFNVLIKKGVKPLCKNENNRCQPFWFKNSIIDFYLFIRMTKWKINSLKKKSIFEKNSYKIFWILRNFFFFFFWNIKWWDYRKLTRRWNRGIWLFVWTISDLLEKIEN